MYEDFKKEYYFEGNNKACLLIHGFTGTPGDLRELGEKLNSEGYTVSGIRLKGHGTNVEDMLDNTYQEWIECALSEYKILKEKYDEVYIAGHSMGALIALYIGENYDVDKLAILSPPLINISKASNYAFILKYFMKYSTWKPREFTKEQEKYILGYNSVPIKSLDQLNKLNSLVKKNLGKVKAPMVIVHSKLDAIVDGKSIDLLKETVKSSLVEIIYLQKGGHLVTIEEEKDKAINGVIEFFNRKI